MSVFENIFNILIGICACLFALMVTVALLLMFVYICKTVWSAWKDGADNE